MRHAYFCGNVKFSLSCWCLLWLVVPVGLSQTVLVKDIVPGPGSALSSTAMVNVNGTLFLAAKDRVSGYELWKSNGTASGTVLVKDLAPGTTNGVPNGSYPVNLTAVNGTLYFSAGNGLYKSDGTAAGTVLLKTFSGGLSSLTAVNGTLYFSAGEAASGQELWKSNGTAAGTVLVKDIAGGTAGSAPGQLTHAGGTLYFTVGGGLYRSNGTAAGTGLVKSFTRTPRELTNLNGVLYFTDGDDVWRSNGTASGTVVAVDFPEGEDQDGSATSGNPYNLTAAGERVYFLVRRNPVEEDLWALGANDAAVVHTFSSYPSSTDYSNFVDVNGRLFFLYGGEYYQALVAVTGDQFQKVREFYAVTGPFTNELTNVNGTLFFTTGGDDYFGAGTELWRSDGTEEGTFMVADINPGFGSSSIEGLVNVNGVLFFTADDGTHGRELWKHIPPRLAPAFRVNAGGNGHATVDERTFAGDACFSGGTVSATTAKDIAGTADDYLYQTGRHGASFSYNFPTGNGSYDVVLHFAETYWGNTAPGGIGSRRFHVNIEGSRKLTDYDIFARAGGALRVAQETFRVNVAGDGTLNVSFLKGAADNPAVKAIEVLPAGSALAINAGGTAFTNAAGKPFSGDVYYAAGAVSSIAGGDIANTTDDELYRNARYGTAFSYGVPSGKGTFDVVLHFAETYWGARTSGGAGSRRFNVDVEGTRRLTNYDIFAKAGGAMRAVKETLRVTVTDGVLNLYFSKGAADNALLSALEVVPVTTAARLAGSGDGGEDGKVSLYPNPVQDQLTVILPFPASRVQAAAITDAQGKAHRMSSYRASGTQELSIGTQTLPKGFYLLRLDTGKGSKVLKFLKQ